MKKRIALIAHDNKKRELVEWTKYNTINFGQQERPIHKPEASTIRAFYECIGANLCPPDG